MLAPNLLRDNYELKTLVMNGPYLLQIWHFNFKGMLERKKESVCNTLDAIRPHPQPHITSLAGKGLKWHYLTLPAPSTTTLLRISASLGQ